MYVVVQGRKQVTVGDETYIYDPSQYLAVSLELPAVGRVVKASPDKPYLCLTLSVDARELAALIVETGLPAPRDDHDGRALYVSPLESPLLEGLLRLVRLLDTPQDIPVLAPLILRELHYRLLQGEQHGRLAEMAIGDGRLRRVAGAIAWIKEHFAEPLQIEALAKRVNMSPSALHSHFKAVAAMSPIQYQKRLRLQEARRRLLSGGTSAEAVAYEVGYASARSSAGNTLDSLVNRRGAMPNACATKSPRRHEPRKTPKLPERKRSWPILNDHDCKRNRHRGGDLTVLNIARSLKWIRSF